MVQSFVAVVIALCVARTRHSPVVAFSTIASSRCRVRDEGRTERAARWGASGPDDDDDETRARPTTTMDRRGALRVAAFGSLATLVVPLASAATTTMITPSAREGELVPSDPPPDRAKAVAVAAAVTSSSSPDPRFFVAGGASAAASHGLAVPVDVVKTRAQSDDPAAETESPLAAASRIVENEGWAALTTGWRPTVLGYGVEGALKFGVYESLKSLLSSRGGTMLGDDAGQLSYLAAAVGAGAIASVALCPAEATRIRSVVDGPGERSDRDDDDDGLSRRVSDLAASFRRGLSPMLAKQVPYTAGKQVSFDVFAAALYGAAGRAEFPPRSGTTALAVEVGAAALSSVVACLASQPGDVLLTAAYAADDDDSGKEEEEEGFGETVRRVYRDGGGARAFIRGLDARLVHVGCIVTFQLVLYDQLKQALGLPGSGT